MDKILQDYITKNGPVDIGAFMQMVLGHPQHGYYMKKDPFGAAGDFTTAPEISQMFGEVIGAWVADVWIKMGSPSAFTLLEMGPGRGTLMADMMRATENVKGFHSACSIHLLEMSPVLKDIQKNTLKAFPGVQWHETFKGISPEQPLIAVANEFLDALPVRQLVMTDAGWKERVIDFKDGQFVFGLATPSPFISLPEGRAEEGEIYELSPERSAFMKNFCGVLKKAKGAALFIDYGYSEPGIGESLQALYKHQYVPVLEHIGDADLTAHVDFAALKEECRSVEAMVSGPVRQGDFLQSTGINQRAAWLSAKATEKQAQDIESALHRLTSSDEMGLLFKVMGLSYGYDFTLAGF
ncbi:MAG: SAM-dependent methyltransferase [Alphaproteobacteria bacterium]|nr:SAM-dependent methyltransferase [Alphaproteobacteria bacterium]